MMKQISTMKYSAGENQMIPTARYDVEEPLERNTEWKKTRENIYSMIALTESSTRQKMKQQTR